MRIVVVACVVAVVVVLAVILLAGTPSSGSSGGPSSRTILAVGNYPIAAGGSMNVKFQELAPFTLIGAWTAETSRGTLTFFLLNESEYAAFNATGSPGGYEVLFPNATGDVSLDLPIPTGTWVFLLVNYDEATVNVDVTHSVAAQN